MERIWKWIFFAFGAGFAVLAVWWNALGVFEHPNNYWELSLLISFFVPVVLLVIAYAYSIRLLKAMNREVRSYKAKEDFRKLITLLCKQGNGKETNDLIFLRITDQDDHYTRQELLKQENYRWVIEQLLQSNRWNGQEHSHKSYIKKIRGIVQETELKNFEALYETLWRGSDSYPDEYQQRQKAFIQTEVLWGLWTLGYGSKWYFVERTPILFEGYDPVELEKLLQDYQKSVSLDILPKVERNAAENAYNQFFLDVRTMITQKNTTAEVLI